jgi:hypothetical protein
MSDKLPTRLAPCGAEWSVFAGNWIRTPDGFLAKPLGADGQPARAGRCELHYPIHLGGCHRARLSCQVRVEEPGGVGLLVNDVQFFIDRRETALLLGRLDVAEAFAPARVEPGAFHELAVETHGRAIAFSVHGREALRYTPPRDRPIMRLGLLVYTPAEFRKVVVMADDLLHRPARSRPAHFRLSCAVDFLDDIRRCRWTEPMIREYMLRMKELGVSRVYWEDVHHFRDDYMTDPEVRALAERDMTREPPGVWQTLQCGWDEFAVAAKAAHDAGLEIYGLIKPFDWHYYDPANEKGNWNKAQQFLYRNPDMIMQRRPRPEGFAPDDAPVRMVRLIGMNDAPLGFSRGDLELWVSDDNAAYRRYAGKMTFTESVERRVFSDWWTQKWEPPRLVRVVTLGGLDLRERHFALRCRRDARTLRNRLYRLVEVESDGGRPIEVTFATEWKEQPSTDRDVSPRSFNWDYNPGVPSARRAGRDVIEYFLAIDGPREWLGVTRGGLRAPQRKWVALSPAYPEVRDFWMSLVRHALDCGADGIDLRAPDAHQRCMTWALRNFNPPMLEAYRQRYGADPATQPYDRSRFCHLAGEFYDHFVEGASSFCRSRGRKLQHHVYGEHDIADHERGSMNIAQHWRQWLEKGWLDGVTLKEVMVDTPMFAEVMDLARAHKVETHYCRYLNTALRSTWRSCTPAADPSWRPVLFDTLRRARQEGCHGAILYEAAALITGTPEGRVEHLYPDAPDIIRQALRDGVASL